MWSVRRPVFPADTEIDCQLSCHLPLVLEVQVVDAVPPRREDDRQITSDAVGLIEEERSERVGEAVRRTSVKSGRTRGEREPAARAESGGLQQISTFPLEVKTPFDDVRAERLGPVVRQIEIGDRATPWQTAIDTDHGSVVAVDEDFGQAARPEVPQVTIRDPELLRKVEARIHICRVISIADHTKSNFHDQRGGENTAVINPGTLISGWPRGVKTAVRRPAVDSQARSIQARISHRGLLVAVADEHTVFDAEDVIHLYVELFDRFVLRVNTLVVVREPGNAWRREEAQVLLGDRADPIGRHPVAGEWRAPGAIWIAGRRVIDCGRARKIAGPHRRRGNGRKGDLAQNIPAPLIVAEKEELVSNDSATGGTAKLVVNRVGNRKGKDVSSLQRAIAVVLEQSAVKIIGTRFHHHVDDGATGPPQLGIIVRRADVDGDDGIGRYHNSRHVSFDVVVDALNQVVVLLVEAVHH